jgi:hypothetical protein
MTDKRTLLDQRDKMMRVIQDPEAPQDLRLMAKQAVDHADVSLGLRAALARKLGSNEAVDAAIAALPDPTNESPYPPLINFRPK